MGKDNHYDVGIVGWWFASNYGSALTYYALGKILEEKGLSSVMLQVSKVNRTPWEPETKKTIDFIGKYFPISDVRPIEMNSEYNEICDAFMLGSDQLWTKLAIDLLGYTFFLDFVDNSKKKIAYATSFGNTNFEGTAEQNNYICKLLDTFDYISVREASGIEACKKYFNQDVNRDLDPVFLCGTKYYDLLADSCGDIEEDDNFIFTYILDVTEEKQKAIEFVANKLGLRVVSVLDMKSIQRQKDKWHIGNLRENASIEEFVYYIKHCKLLITDSHHGACFGMIYEKDLITIANAGRGLTRFTHLFNLFELGDKLLTNVEEIYTREELFEPIDYVKFNTIKEREKAASFEHFNHALDGERSLEKKSMPKSNTLDKKLLPELSVEAVYSQMLAALLRDYGIKHVVLSSGSRHLQLVRFFEYNDCFTVHKVIDERSAGFYALGLATKLKSPVILCCTSGTAASNYHTAIAEAYYQHVPLIVITADRPSCLLNQREGQMIAQKNIYKDICLKSVSLDVIDSGFGKAVARRMICETIMEATHRTPGPVHINIPFSEIYKRYYEEDFPSLYNIARVKIHRIIRHMLVPDRTSWKPALKRLIESKRILIVYGQNYVLTEDEQSALEKFVQQFNCVVCTDNLSNMKCSKSVNAYNICHVFNTSKEVVEELRPEIVITVYGSNVSEIGGFVKKHPNIEHWDVAPDGNAADPYRKLRRIFECTPTGFFKRLNLMAEEHNGEDSYYQLWKKYEKPDAAVPEKYSQRYAVCKTIKGISSGSLLHLANSNTVRMACSYSPAPDVTVYCNRGTNGIDGSASTFMGQVALSTELCFLLIGDLSFFYDMNSLWNKRITPNIRIMLFNNSGAGLLKHHGSDVISHMHNTSAEAWVKSLGFKYFSSRTKEEFDENIGTFLSEGDEAIFFEVFTE